MIKKEAPDVIFLQETKVTSNFFSSKKFLLGFENAFAIDFVGRSGGLAVLWKGEIDFTLLQFSSHHIHGKITMGKEGKPNHSKWNITGVYRHPDTSRHEEVWKIIRDVKCLDATP